MNVGVLPGVTPRLMRDSGGWESIAEYRDTGGYAELPGATALLDMIEASGLRGRGGASFPAGRKMRAVRAGEGVPVIVANGEEGEPASVKDRWLLRTRPHLVLDGIRHAAVAVGADLAYVYLSDADAERSVIDAIAELAAQPVELRVVRVDPAYIAGEETAAVRYLGGGPAKPADKPPRPFESGVDGRPTLVSNVETLANLPLLTRLGVDGYRAQGTHTAPGTFLLTLGGSASSPGLYEVPLGTPMARVLEAWGGVAPAGLLMGGYFGGLLGERGQESTLDYDSVALGCGAVTVLGREDCPVHVAAAVMAYFDRSNAGQCGSCFNGTAAMSAVLSALVARTATGEDVARLRRWSTMLPRRGACGTLDGAAQLAASLLREFPGAVASHVDGVCAACPADGRVDAAVPFAMEVPGVPAGLLRS
ncbi:hypothetical protein HFP15_01675 [Amycolatopsis sp. K13G38]|uniref:NADH-ubiquinone oxidoreductase 51kDa subunit iron-sulphur binding domain-containing protein n=1 Tax=Amycolatopsis acididurans TaxID=2724524 RepID=A0ABX1IVS5_9PSEU|nr:NADH-ubiquinone oxidoreductase-F iron-sulfur binding region domain-containing protein [Amycolatopsis acididurans]NKQ51585.1 hypothetical protein [Amycolatopsis acididurans]